MVKAIAVLRFKLTYCLRLAGKKGGAGKRSFFIF